MTDINRDEIADACEGNPELRTILERFHRRLSTLESFFPTFCNNCHVNFLTAMAAAKHECPGLPSPAPADEESGR